MRDWPTVIISLTATPRGIQLAMAGEVGRTSDAVQPTSQNAAYLTLPARQGGHASGAGLLRGRQPGSAAPAPRWRTWLLFEMASAMSGVASAKEIGKLGRS